MVRRPPPHRSRTDDRLLSSVTRPRIRANRYEPPALPVAEAIANPHHSGHHDVAPKLRQIGNVVDIELRADEDVVGDKDLYARAAMHIKVVGALDKLRRILVAQYGTGGTGLIELEIRGADAAFQLEGHFLGVDRLEDPVDIEYGHTGLYG